MQKNSKMQNLNENRKIDANREESGGRDVKKMAVTKPLSRTNSIAYIGRNRTSLGLNHSKDKELINNGLQKLVFTLNNRTGSNNRISRPVVHDRNASKESVQVQPNFGSNIVLNKQVSVDKCTMTDFEISVRRLEEESTVLNESTATSFDTSPGRALQWTDSRLIRKYAITKKPYKKSFTIPFVNKGENLDETDAEEEGEPEICYPSPLQNFFKVLYYFCTTSVSFIGSFCGITLITLILSKVVDETFWNFRFETPRNEFILKTYFNFGVSSFYYVLRTIVGGIMNVLTLPTNQVLGRDEELFWHKLLDY